MKGEKVDMCRAFDQLEERGEKRGEKRGKEKAEIQMIGNAYKQIGDASKVAELLGVSTEKVKKVIQG